MNKFDVTVIRTSVRSMVIGVTASSFEQAQEKALENIGSVDFNTENEARYMVENCLKIEKELMATAASAFTSGDNPYEEYQKLVSAKNCGEGEAYASMHAEIWEPFEFFTVTDLLSAIETHMENIKGFTLLVNGQ